MIRYTYWTENDNVTWSQYNLALKLLWWGDCLNSTWIPDKKSRFIGQWTGRRISMGTLSKLTWEKKHMCLWWVGISSRAHFKYSLTHKLKGENILISTSHKRSALRWSTVEIFEAESPLFHQNYEENKKTTEEIFNDINYSWRKETMLYIF